MAVAHRHNLGNEIFVGQSDGRETLETPADVLAVIDRDFFACKFCGIASSLGFCLKLPEAVSSASPRLGTIGDNRSTMGRRCSRRASVPRAALRSALGYLLLPLWGGRIDGYGWQPGSDWLNHENWPNFG